MNQPATPGAGERPFGRMFAVPQSALLRESGFWPPVRVADG
jgi:hypothetical protein